tara:strand:- start:195 stop:371 length:177 start_codon:yes stop_codon:yes gene_type:complete
MSKINLGLYGLLIIFSLLILKIYLDASHIEVLMEEIEFIKVQLDHLDMDIHEIEQKLE